MSHTKIINGIEYILCCSPLGCPVCLPKDPDEYAKYIYAEIRKSNNPFAKTWDELSEKEKTESRALAKRTLGISDDKI